MTEDESLLDAQISFRHIYHKEQTADFLDKNPEVEKIFEQIYDMEYKYLNEWDSLIWKDYSVEYNSLLSSIPMFYLPLETDVYYKKNLKKYLVKKRLGFYGRFDNPLEYDRTATFSHELDTALLALPIKFFQQKYLETRDIYCLDGQTFPLTRAAPYPENDLQQLSTQSGTVFHANGRTYAPDRWDRMREGR
jgi:hypothetical protein